LSPSDKDVLLCALEVVHEGTGSQVGFYCWAAAAIAARRRAYQTNCCSIRGAAQLGGRLSTPATGGSQPPSSSRFPDLLQNFRLRACIPNRIFVDRPLRETAQHRRSGAYQTEGRAPPIDHGALSAISLLIGRRLRWDASSLALNCSANSRSTGCAYIRFDILMVIPHRWFQRRRVVHSWPVALAPGCAPVPCSVGWSLKILMMTGFPLLSTRYPFPLRTR
jgi:hypothetical protein